MDWVHVNLKVPVGMVEIIEKDIADNKYHRNRSEWINNAIRHYIEHRMQMANALGGHAPEVAPKSNTMGES